MESNNEIQKIIEDMPLNDMQANLKLLSLSDQSILRLKQTGREYSLDAAKSPRTPPRLQANMRPSLGANRGVPLGSPHATIVGANSPLVTGLLPSHQHHLLGGGPILLSDLGPLSHSPSELFKHRSLRNSLKTRKGVTSPKLSDAVVLDIDGVKVKRSKFMIAVVNDEKQREYVTGVTLEYMIMRITKEISDYNMLTQFLHCYPYIIQDPEEVIFYLKMRWNQAKKVIQKSIKFFIRKWWEKWHSETLKRALLDFLQFFLIHADKQGTTELMDFVNGVTPEKPKKYLPGDLNTLGQELCESCWKGDLENVRKIFTLPESIYVINYLNDRAQTPLYCAARLGHAEICLEILNQPQVNVNYQVKGHLGTPLHASSFYGHAEATALMLARGAKMTIENLERMTPFQQARGEVVNVYSSFKDFEGEFQRLYPIIKRLIPEKNLEGEKRRLCMSHNTREQYLVRSHSPVDAAQSQFDSKKKSSEITYTDREQALDILSPRRVLNDLDRQNAGAKLTRSKGGMGRQRAASDFDEKQLTHAMEKHVGMSERQPSQSALNSNAPTQKDNRLSSTYQTHVQGMGVIRLSPRTSDAGSGGSGARISPRLSTPSPALITQLGSSGASASSPLLSPCGDSPFATPLSARHGPQYASTGGMHSIQMAALTGSGQQINATASTSTPQTTVTESAQSTTATKGGQSQSASPQLHLHQLYLATTLTVSSSSSGSGRSHSYHYPEPPLATNSALEQNFTRDILTTEELLSLTQTNVAAASTVGQQPSGGKKSLRGLKKTFTTDSYFKLTGNYDGPYLPREKLKPSSWTLKSDSAETSATTTTTATNIAATTTKQRPHANSKPQSEMNEPTHIVSASTNVSSSHATNVEMSESPHPMTATWPKAASSSAAGSEATTTAISTADASPANDQLLQIEMKEEPSDATPIASPSKPGDSISAPTQPSSSETPNDAKAADPLPSSGSTGVSPSTRGTRRGSKTVRRGSSKSKMASATATPTSASPSPNDSAANSPRGEGRSAIARDEREQSTATTTGKDVRSESDGGADRERLVANPSGLITSSASLIVVKDESGKTKKKVLGRKISIGPIGGKDKRDRGKSQEEHNEASGELASEQPSGVTIQSDQSKPATPTSSRPSMGQKRKSLPNLLLGLMTSGGSDKKEKEKDRSGHQANEAGEQEKTVVSDGTGAPSGGKASASHVIAPPSTSNDQQQSTTHASSTTPTQQSVTIQDEKGGEVKETSARATTAQTDESTTTGSSVSTGEQKKVNPEMEKLDDLSASKRDEKRQRELAKKAEKEREKELIKEKAKKRRSDKKRGKNVGSESQPNLRDLSVGNQQFAANNPQPRHRSRSLRQASQPRDRTAADATDLTDVTVSKTLGGEGAGSQQDSESIDEVDLFSAQPSFFIRDIAGEVGQDLDFDSLGLDGALKEKKRDAKKDAESTTQSSSATGSPISLSTSSNKHSKDRRVIMSDLKRELHLDLLSSRKRESNMSGDEYEGGAMHLAKSVRKEKEREEKREREEKKEKEREEKAMERREQAASRKSEKDLSRQLNKQGSGEHARAKKHERDSSQRKASERNITFLLLEDELLKVGIRPNNEILLVDPLVIAEVITVNEHLLFARIPLTEFYNVKWKRPDKAVQTPGILSLITWFNNMSAWVTTEILIRGSPKARARTIQHFIRIAECAERLSNFNAVTEITFALGSMYVKRLKETWAYVSKESTDVFEKLKELVSPMGNFKNIRFDLKNCNSACIPYIGIFLQDLIALEEIPVLSDEYGITRQQNTDKLFDSVEFHPTPSAQDQQGSDKGSFSEESVPRAIQRKLSLNREDGSKLVQASPASSIKDSTQSMALHVLTATTTQQATATTHATVNATTTQQATATTHATVNATTTEASSTTSPSSGSSNTATATAQPRFFHRAASNPANQSTITSSVANVEAIAASHVTRTNTVWTCEKCNVEASEAEPFCQQCGAKVAPTSVASPITHVTDSIGAIRTRVSSDHLEKLAFIESLTASTAQPLVIAPYPTANVTIAPVSDNLGSGNTGTATTTTNSDLQIAPTTTEASNTGPQAVSQLDDILGDLMDLCGRLEEKLDINKSSDAISGTPTGPQNAASVGAANSPTEEPATDDDSTTRGRLTETRRSESARILSALPRIKSANSPLGSPSSPNANANANTSAATATSPVLPKRSTSLVPEANAPSIPARSTSLAQPTGALTATDSTAPPLPSRTTSLVVPSTNESPAGSEAVTEIALQSPPTQQQQLQSDSAAASLPGDESCRPVSPGRKASATVLSMSLHFTPPLTLSGVTTETPLTLSSPEPIPLSFSTPRETVVAKVSTSEAEQSKEKEKEVAEKGPTVRSPFKIITAASLATSLSHASSQSNSPAQARRDSESNTTTACSTKDFGPTSSTNAVPLSPYLAKVNPGKTSIVPNATTTPIKDSTNSSVSTSTASITSSGTSAAPTTTNQKEGNAGGSHWINLHKCHKFTNILLDIQRYQTICYNFETPVEKIFFVHKYVTELKPILTEDDFLRFTKLCES